MKYLKITAIVFSIGLLLQVFAYLNLMVSYKYEVDLMETNIEVSDLSSKEKTVEFKRMLNRKKEIVHQQKNTKLYFVLFLIGLIIVVFFLFYKNIRR